MLEPINILIVDDNPNNLFTLHNLINEHIEATIVEANSGTVALEILLQQKIDLILLDVQMPDMDGFETAQLIRSRKKTQHIPIVFLTAAFKSDEFKQKGFLLGAADYLTKPIDAPQLISRIRSYLRFIEQDRQHHQDLEKRVHERTVALLDANKHLQLEIEERKQIEQKLKKVQEELEQRVAERTLELSNINQQLKAEINERQQAKVALEHLNRYMQLILESAGEGIFGLDMEGKTTFVNPVARKMLGYEDHELIGLQQHAIIHYAKPDQSPYLLEECPIYQALKQGASYRRDDEVFWRKDGHCFPVEYMQTPILEEGQVTGAVVTFRDITERKEAENRLQEAKESAERAQKIAETANLAKSQFLANMSHELRTPLNAIIGYSEMLQEEADSPQFISDLKKIHSAGKHLLSLINDVLDISKIEAGKMELFVEQFDLKGLLQEVVSTVQPLMEKNKNQFEVQLAADLESMQADLSKLRQILLNLLSNAAKFTEQGVVSITVNRERTHLGEVILFEVIDDGIGMTVEQQKKLFRPFSQADSSTTRKYGGTGLGLAITKEFTEMMGGEIQVHSEFGQGSTFQVQLPRQVAVPFSQTTEIPFKGHGVILIIDDDRIILELLQDYLNQLGYAVAVATSGPEGLKLAKKLRPDAVLLDVTMPGMDGWQVLSALKSDPLLSDIPVIMASVVEGQEKGLALGAIDYLVKPIGHEQLVSVLSQHHIGDDSQGLVMVVDDEIVFRELLTEMLKGEGWRVFKAENGVVALEHLEDKKPALIFLDLMMPEMDGFEFFERLQNHVTGKSIPVVVFTSVKLSDQEESRLKGVQKVFYKYAHSQEELLVRVHEQLAQLQGKYKK